MERASRAVEKSRLVPAGADEELRLDTMNRVVTQIGRDFNRTRLYERVARDSGIHMEKHLLYLLSRIHQYQPIRLIELAYDMEIVRTTVSRNVQDLVKRGLVRRIQDPDDARALLFEVTSEGEQVLRSSWRAWNDILVKVMAGWSETDRRRLEKLLGRFASALDALIWEGENGLRRPQ